MNAPAKATTSKTKKPENATARVTLLMTPTEKEDLFARAAEQGFESVGEYLRRKAFDHDPELDALVAEVRESTARAVLAVNRSLELIESRTQETAEHDAAIRAEAAREFASWTPDQQRAVGQLLGGDL